MASWEDLTSYIHANYNVAKDSGSVIQLVFETTGQRSQLVFVLRTATGSGIPFASILSPFARPGEVDIDAALLELGEYVVGGIVLYADKYMVRHAIPLMNLDTNEFTTPLTLVTNAADALEHKFLGSDSH